MAVNRPKIGDQWLHRETLNCYYIKEIYFNEELNLDFVKLANVYGTIVREVEMSDFLKNYELVAR